MGDEVESKCSPPKKRHAELVSASISQPKPKSANEKWTLKQVQGDGFFFETVLRLFGQTAMLLGWKPDDFWHATPAELATILAAFKPEGDAANGNTLTQLMEQFPDG